MEIWDIYDKDGRKQDFTITRGEKIPEGYYHLVVHIIIVNSEGDFLIQKRADCKDLWPGMWAFTGGSACTGEDSVTAAVRELHEETGICLHPKKLSFIERQYDHNHFSDIWYGICDADLNTLDFQKEEVSALDYQSLNNIKAMIEEEVFHKYSDSYLDIVFNIGGKI